MSGSIVLLHLAGAVALLLYATRMIRTGVERAYGVALRQHLQGTRPRPALALLVGLALAMAMQSATAVSLLVSSFVSSGVLISTVGMMVVLGADLGSALMVTVLSHDLSVLAPVALVIGTVCFMHAERRGWRQTGRLAIGLGLLLLSLKMIGEASEPLRESPILPIIVSFLENDLMIACLLAALAAWLFHSSVAFVLFVVALAARDLVPLALGLAFVLGANLGGGMVAVLLSRTLPPAGQIVPLCNFLLRGALAFFLLPFIPLVDLPSDLFGVSIAIQVALAHVLFNVLLLFLGVPLSGVMIRFISSLMHRASSPVTSLGPALCSTALKDPPFALANATRELIGIFERIRIMLEDIEALYETPDKGGIAALTETGQQLDLRYAALKVYLARIQLQEMSNHDAQRCTELIEACVKLEQVGDVIRKNLLVHVRTKLDKGVCFSAEGWQELRALHAAVRHSAQLAFNLLIYRDSKMAVELVHSKQSLRHMAKDTSQRHFERLRSGVAQSLQSSSLHLSTVRDLKQIHSLLASMAYPMLERDGMLSASRLTTP